MKRIISFLVVICLITAGLCSCSSKAVVDDIADQTANVAQADDENVLAVKGGTNSNYPGITYEQAFESFFAYPTWKYFKGVSEGPDENGDGKPDYTENDIDVVEFTGNCTYMDTEVKARIQFTLNKDEGTFESTYLSFNNVPQTSLIMYSLIDKAFETYQKEHGESVENVTSSAEEDDGAVYVKGEFSFDEEFYYDWYDKYPLLLHENGSTTMSVKPAGDDRIAIFIDGREITTANEYDSEEIGHLRHQYYCDDGSELTVAYSNEENCIRFVPEGGGPSEGLYYPAIPVDSSSSTATANKYKNIAEHGPVNYNGHAYAIFNFREDLHLDTFDECEEYCENMGGHLAVIDSEDENEFLFSYLKDCDMESAFFGYTDEDVTGDWKWVDGSDSRYTNWGSGQPNNRNGEEHYAQFYGDMGDGIWNDAKFGSQSWRFICEWE